MWGSDGLHACLVLPVVERSSSLLCASCEGTYGGCSQGGCSFSEPVDDCSDLTPNIVALFSLACFVLFRLERAPATRLWPPLASDCVYTCQRSIPSSCRRQDPVVVRDASLLLLLLQLLLVLSDVHCF